MTQRIKNILNFPIQFKEPHEYKDDAERIAQAKLSWVKLLNFHALGLYQLTDDQKQCVRRLNEICLEYGYEPLHSDF